MTGKMETEKSMKGNSLSAKRQRDMELGEFNLIVLLVALIVENIVMLPIAILMDDLGRMGIFMAFVALGGILLLVLELRTGRARLTAILALLILNGVAIPVVLRQGYVVYGLAVMWFVLNILIMCSVLEGALLGVLLVLFACEQCFLYGSVFYPYDGSVFRADQVFHFTDLSISFIGTAILLAALVFSQKWFYDRQRRKIAVSSSKIADMGMAKRQFLENISYEIRTPMNSIISLSELMLKGDQDGGAKGEIGTVRRAAYDLLTIIDDVLTYARLDAGDTRLIEEEYSSGELLQGILRTISEEAQKKKLYLDVKFDGAIPSRLYGDSVTVRQIFLYLLFISLDFTTRGRVILEVKCDRDEETEEAVFHCTVADTGRGLSQIDIQSLFGMYDTYDSRQSSNLKGIGLKFTICKELLAMMQGSIRVESIENVGLSTTFTFRQKIVDGSPMVCLEEEKKPKVLIYAGDDFSVSKWQGIMDVFDVRPQYCSSYYGFDKAVQDRQFDFIFLTDDVYENLSNIISLYQCGEYTYVLSDSDAVYGNFDKCRPIHRPLSCLLIAEVLNHRWKKEDYRQKNEETFTAGKARVLVVDDNAVNLKVAAGIFSKYGIDIAVATCGEDGIRKIEEEEYDLVLMDMVMPDMDGGEVLHAIRAREEAYYKKLPFVALTAQNGATVREEMLALGFQEYLAKPIKRRYLEKCLLEFLPEELIEHVDAKDNGGAKDGGQPAAGAAALPPGGLNTEKGLLNIGFNQDAYAAILNTYYTEGVKYLDLLPKLLEAGDIQLFTTDVHGIKSSSASIGAMEVSALFKELEFHGKAGDVETINRKFNGYLDKFKEILEEVRNYLTGIGKFSEEEAQDDLADKEIETLTAEMLQNLKTELDRMNMKVTDELVPELAGRNFGSEINASMKKLKEAYDMFDFHQVKAIVNEMMEKI